MIFQGLDLLPFNPFFECFEKAQGHIAKRSEFADDCDRGRSLTNVLAVNPISWASNPPLSGGDHSNPLSCMVQQRR